jgi:nicotinamide phosphoribosyltransferase
MEAFGYTVTSTGHKLLPNHIRVLQGDGINERSIADILQKAADWRGLAAENFVFGMGGAMLQQVNRDTLKFAMKANEIVINGKAADVYKDPIHGGKKSKRGRQAVVGHTAIRESELASYKGPNQLKVVFFDSEVKSHQTLDDIRKRINLVEMIST